MHVDPNVFYGWPPSVVIAEKIDAEWRPPERVVGGLAAKTPLGGRPKVHHRTLGAND